VSLFVWPINEAYVFDAAWIFLAGWSAVVLALSLIAFRVDFARNMGRRPGFDGHVKTLESAVPRGPGVAG
jgi:hypothetical protein